MVSPYLVGLIVFLVFDFLWLGSNINSYKRLVALVQKEEMQFNTLGLLAYPFLYLGLVLIAYPQAKIALANGDSKVVAALKAGGMLGLVIYGTFNFTNIAMFKEYDLLTGLKDTVWGGVLFFVATLAMIWF